MKYGLFVLLSALVVLTVVACARATPTPTPVPTSTHTPTPSTPAAPANLQALSIHDRLSIWLTWEDRSDNETSFIVERSEAGEIGPWQEIAVLPANTTTHTDDGLSDGVTYYYRVRAWGVGDSPYSNVAGDAATALPTPTPTPTPDPWRQVAEKVWDEKVRMTMYLWDVPEDVVKVGQMLRVRVRVENISDTSVTYVMSNIGDPPVIIRVIHPYDGAVYLRAPGDPPYVQPAVDFDRLEPGQVIEREVAWDMTITLDGTATPVPNGGYTFHAIFFPVGGDGSRTGVTVSRAIRVVNSTTLVTPSDARQRAYSQPSVRRWLEGHMGDAIARQEKGRYLVNIQGEWQETSKELYDEVVRAIPQPSARYDAGDWVLTFASKYGFQPYEMLVTVNGATGEVKSLAPDLLAELAGGVVATFDVLGTAFHVFVTNPDTIEELYRLQRGESTASIPNGTLRPGPGAGMHNLPWSWHLDPDDTHMADFTIELCDGTPAFVEEDLEYWLDTVGQYCPWNATLVSIEDYR